MPKPSVLTEREKRALFAASIVSGAISIIATSLLLGLSLSLLIAMIDRDTTDLLNNLGHTLLWSGLVALIVFLFTLRRLSDVSQCDDCDNEDQ